MKELIIRFCDWIMRHLNDAFNENWVTEEEKQEWCEDRRRYYEARKKIVGKK